MGNVGGERMEIDSIITTDEQKCEGCNKCINVCPIPDANIAYNIDGKNKIKIDSQKCIHCGYCLEFCDHDARQYHDDTEKFFEELKQGKKFSLLVAPSFRVNFNEYKKIFGFFKDIGVNLIFDVSFGAEICTWVILKLIKEKKISSIISQSCPVIVNYIEKYQPSLIQSLTPVYSPMICSAVYLQKYQKCDDELVFLSPCIAKINEIKNMGSKKLITHSITFKKLQEYIKSNRIEVNDYKETNYDFTAHSLGVIFSKPGGLRDNITSYIKDIWIDERSGQKFIYKYLKEYEKRLISKLPIPQIADLLNCKFGCNIGTAVERSVSIYDIGYISSKLKKENNRDKLDNNSSSITKDINEIFNNELEIVDFLKEYKDLSNEISTWKEPSEKEYEAIFSRLHKYTVEEQNVNCFSCGYNSCKKMAKAIFNNINYPGNCIDYNKLELQVEIYQKKKVLKELEYIAFNDSLTNLPNRRKIKSKLESVIAKARKNHRRVGILFIDLDKFKMINDILGHDTGDYVLKKSAERLKETILEKNFVGRLGGDEFLAIIDNMSEIDKINDIAKNIIRIFEKPIEFKGRQIYITCSVGICIFPENGKTVKTLMRNADISMYKVKENLGNSFEFYDNEMNTEIQKQFHLAEKIREGIQKKQFILYYQPKVDVETGEISGLEALVRWNHPDKGLIPPNEFINIAEETGLIQKIDQYVLELACSQIKKWIDTGIKNINVSVNVSAKLFNDYSFVEQLQTIIEKTEIDPSYISIEITETAAMKNIKYSYEILNKLRQKGILILLDDFGIGYSSLNYLRELPIDVLKIDKSFVDKIHTDKINNAIMEAIINMAKALEIRVVAEGVETEQQLQILKKLGCNHYQGYLFSKPLPPEEIEKIL